MNCLAIEGEYQMDPLILALIVVQVAALIAIWMF